MRSTFHWAPDGKKIAYVAGDSREGGIGVTNADGSNNARIAAGSTPDASLHSPFWSRDSKSIAYVSEATVREDTTWSVFLERLESGNREFLFQANSVITPLGWLPSGNDLLIAVKERSPGFPPLPPVSLIQVSAIDRSNRTISTLESAYIDNIRLSQDGKSIAFVSRSDGRDNLWVIPATGGRARRITSNLDSRLYFSSLVWAPDGKCIYYGKQLKWSLITMLDNNR
jgi:TolB protein